MSFNLVTNLEACYDFVVNDAPLSLVYYSHFTTIIISLLVGILVLRNSRPPITGKVLFSLSVFFSLWVVIDLITWTSYNSTYYMFFWSLFGVLTALVYLFCIYFAYVFINKRDISFAVLSVFSILIAPIVFLIPTNYNLSGFLVIDCISIEEVIYTNYFLLFGALAFVWVAISAFIGYRKTKENVLKKQIILMTVGLELFITIFFTATFLDSYLVNIGVTGDYMLGNYGLFGMAIFMAFLAYLIVQFKAFNIKLIGANVLVITLAGLVGSLLFVVQSTTSLIIAGVTFILSVVFGYFLIRSVRKEVEAREYIQELAGELATSRDQLLVANEKLQELDKQKTEFVSIASHQLRSPLTAIKGYSSMILEGSFGEINGKTKDAVDKIFQSSQRLVNIIEDFLNVTRIELGTMKYEMSEINVKDMTKKIIEELRPNIEDKGLGVSFKADKGNHTVYADAGKISQVIGNIIDNAIKYTPEGSIDITLTGQNGTILLAVKDSGVGIPKETLPKLFEKFIRADDAGKTNISGTGLGLYVAKQIVEAHRGRIWAESDGKGHGSTFFIEFKRRG